MPNTGPLLPRRTEIIAGMLDEYDRFTELLATLGADDWMTSTRCDAPVRDVAVNIYAG